MKKLFFTSVFLFAVAVAATAQKDTVSHWKRAFQSGININQATFSDNWKGGGNNSISLGMFLNAKANYETEKISFNTELQTQYGFLKNKGLDTRKNSDRIFFDSKLGYKFTPKLNGYVSINFLSQFDKGYKYSTDTAGREVATYISKFLAPGYLTSSLGVEYRPVSYFWIRFGTGTFRQTFVVDTLLYKNESKNYGVEIGKKTRNEVAFLLTANFDKDIAKNINLKVNFTAFGAYTDLQAWDTRLDMILSAKVNKFINVNLSGTLLYDQDMDYETQYSQMLAIGILYSFSEFGK